MRVLALLLLLAFPAHAQTWDSPTIGQNEGHLDFPSPYTVTAEYDADAWPHNGWLRLISQAVGAQTYQHRFMISDGNSGRIRVRACADGNTIVLLGSGLSLEPQRADVTFDGSFVRVYLDGTQVTSAALSGTACPSDGADLLLGAQPPGGTNQFQGTIDYIRLLDYAMTSQEIDEEINGDPTPPDPPPDPPPGDFGELCAQSGVVLCEPLDDLSGAARNSAAGGTPSGESSDPYKPDVDTTVYADGTGSLRMTIDGSNWYDVTGIVGYAFPQITSGSTFVAFKIRFGDGLQEFMQTGTFDRTAGMKYLGLVPGSNSCDAQEVYISDNALYAVNTGVPQLYHTCSGHAYRSGADWQPVEGDLDNCGFTYIHSKQGDDGESVESPPCVLFSDDVWHQIELEVDVSEPRTRLWIDGVLTVDQPAAESGLVPQGPYGRVYMGNYMTGYKAEQAGDGTYGNGLWRVWYDNLIVSTDCITSC